MRKKTKKEENNEIQKDFAGRIYGYRMTDYKSILELNILYEQILNLKSKKAKGEIIKAIQDRAITLAKPTNRKIIKEIFKNN